MSQHCWQCKSKGIRINIWLEKKIRGWESSIDFLHWCHSFIPVYCQLQSTQTAGEGEQERYWCISVMSDICWNHKLSTKKVLHLPSLCLWVSSISTVNWTRIKTGGKLQEILQQWQLREIQNLIRQLHSQQSNQLSKLTLWLLRYWRKCVAFTLIPK